MARLLIWDRANGNLNLDRKNGCLDGANRNLSRTNGTRNWGRAKECDVHDHETHTSFVPFAFFAADGNMKKFLNCDF